MWDLIPRNLIHSFPIYDNVTQKGENEFENYIYVYQKSAVDGEIMPKRYYKIIDVIDKIKDIDINTALIKEVFKNENGEWVDEKEGVHNTTFSLSRSDCSFLGVDYEEGIESIPKEQICKFKRIPKVEKENKDDKLWYEKTSDGIVHRMAVKIDGFHVYATVNSYSLYNHLTNCRFSIQYIKRYLAVTFTGANSINSLSPYFKLPYKILTPDAEGRKAITNGQLWLEIRLDTIKGFCITEDIINKMPMNEAFSFWQKTVFDYTYEANRNNCSEFEFKRSYLSRCGRLFGY